MKSFAAIIAAVGFVASVHAETAVKTEYFYQTPADKNQVTPGLSYNDGATKYKAAASGKNTTTTIPLTVRYERGLAEEWSVGAELGYMLSGSGKNNADKYDIKGMSDITAFLRGQHGIQSNMSVHYGLDLTVPLAKRKVKSTTAGGQTEASYETGRFLATPYVGMAYAMDAHIFGAKLLTQFDIGNGKIENDTNGTTTTDEVKNGHKSQLSVFYETAMAGSIIGAELYYNGISGLKTKTSGATAWGTAEGSTNLGLKVYGAHDLNENTTILANVSYEMSQSEPTAVDSINAWGLGVAGRFTF